MYSETFDSDDVVCYLEEWLNWRHTFYVERGW